MTSHEENPHEGQELTEVPESRVDDEGAPTAEAVDSTQGAGSGEGDEPAADSAAAAEDTAAEDTAAEQNSAGESGADSEESEGGAAEEEAEGQEAEEEEADPVEELRAALRRAPGEWFVIHSYAGYENKVKNNLETRAQTLDVEDYVFQVEVPTEEVTEVKNGQRKQVQRKVLPGYVLVRMELNDASWSAVRNTPGVTGFVGATNEPSPLTINDVLKFLAPQAEKQAKPEQGKKAAQQPAQQAVEVEL